MVDSFYVEPNGYRLIRDVDVGPDRVATIGVQLLDMTNSERATALAGGYGAAVQGYVRNLPKGVISLQGVPYIAYREGGTTAAPLSTFNGATSSGVIGTAQPLLFPGNSIIPGISCIKFRAQVGKAGASVGSLDVRLGTTNSSADTNLMSGVAPSWTATTPSEIFLDGVITFGTGGRAKLVATANVQSVGNNFRFGAEVTGLDFTVDNYLNFVISGTSAGTTFPVVAYEASLFS